MASALRAKSAEAVSIAEWSGMGGVFFGC